jgi:hypothetical protein
MPRSGLLAHDRQNQIWPAAGRLTSGPRLRADIRNAGGNGSTLPLHDIAQTAHG